jgi:pyruvate dehydrogenase E2 component (dihydrolipoamide acetyltransferase)
MTEGTLIEWKKKVGDRVTKGEIIAEVDTDKAAIEIESFHTGVIEQLLTKPGDTVAVGTVMAVIREEDKEGKIKAEGKVEEKGGRLRVSPAARQLATELGVNLSAVHGTGPDGAITSDDVRRSAPTQPIAARPSPLASSTAMQATPLPSPRRGEGKGEGAADAAADKQARMRQTIAAAMARSKREIPHYYLSTTIDMGPAADWLAQENTKRPVTDRLLMGALLLKAVALALREVPELNAVWKGAEVAPSPDIHVGVAVSLRGGGLVAPALHHADRQSLDDLMRNFQDLIKRARAGTLRSSEMSDPTITVTSLGDQGVETVFGVIYPPQVALVGLGKVVERPWVVNGRVVSRPVLTASLSADHRVTDGHRGGLFLAKLDRLLQEPSRF